MRATTFGGADVFLCDHEPNMDGPFTATLDLLAVVTPGLSNRESRRAFGETLRWGVSYDSLVEGEQARRLEGALRDYQTQPVAMPVWPFVSRWADRATLPVCAGAWVVYTTDWQTWELYADGAEPVWPTDDDLVAPVLFGKLNGPKPQWQDPGFALLSVDFTENSAAALAVRPKCDLLEEADTFADGPTPSVAWTAAPKLCPFAVDFDRETHEFRVNVIRDRIGFKREDAETIYEQTNAKAAEQGFTETELAEFGRVLAFFFMHGAGSAFWLPGNTSAVVLSAAVAAIDTELDVTDTHAVRAGDWLALTDHDQDAAFVTVDSVDADTVFLTGAVGAAFTANRTLVSRLSLARFERPRLTLTWADQSVLSFTFAVREVPEEYTPAADETIGQVAGATLGKLPTPVFLYLFERDLGNGTMVTTRWTNYEDDVSYDGETWRSRHVSHGDIRQSLNLEREAVELTTFLDAADPADNPLLDDVKLTSEGPLRLTIRQLGVVFTP